MIRSRKKLINFIIITNCIFELALKVWVAGHQLWRRRFTRTVFWHGWLVEVLKEASVEKWRKIVDNSFFVLKKPCAFSVSVVGAVLSRSALTVVRTLSITVRTASRCSESNNRSSNLWVFYARPDKLGCDRQGQSL